MALSALNLICIAYGNGRHQSLQEPAARIISGQLSYATRVMYLFVLGTTKIGLCVFYLRIFQDRTSKIMIYTLVGFICAVTVALEVYVAARCRPSAMGEELVCSITDPSTYITTCS